MSSHIAHTRDESGLPLLDDECPRCVEQAGDLGIHLDEEKWRRAYQQMVAVEFYVSGAYRSKADKDLGRSLYLMHIVLQRNFGIDSRTLVPLA